MFALPMRGYRKTYNPSHYNQRFNASQGLDNNYVQYVATIHGADGYAPKQTNRDPNKFNYSSNLWNNDYWELRMRAGDYLYQIFSRLHRSNDGWTRTLIGWTSFSFLMFNQALIWKLHFAFFTMATLSRIRDKGCEPVMDEIMVLDTVFANEKLRKLFSPDTYHIIDYDQEWDKGLDNPYFPEYRTPIARFFNTDTNTTTGRYKFGDLESGATMTLHFKTMPFANNKYHFSEPFMVYDMWAEVQHDGKYFTEQIVKAEEILKTKRIFVIWH